MQQVLFRIPYLEIPIYGYGAMLFLAFIACSWLTAWRAEKEGIARSCVHDVIIWLFLGGILGARVTYMIQYQVPLDQFFVIWKGGLVFYGSFFGGVISYGVWRAVQEGREVLHEQRKQLAIWIAVGAVIGAIAFAARRLVENPEEVVEPDPSLRIPLIVFGAVLGGLVGFSFAYILRIQRFAPPNWKFMDVMAPSVALGLALGRIGCLLNGCCFGNVACAHCPAIHFPLSAPSRGVYTSLGYQTAAGFTVQDGRADPRTIVGVVERDSPAYNAGLRDGDRIIEVNGEENRILIDIERLGNAPAWNHVLAYLKEQGRVTEMLGPNRLRVFYNSPEAAREDMRLFQGPEWRKSLVTGPITDVFQDLLVNTWPQGETHLTLSVVHEGADTPAVLPTFRPLTIGLHPTQIYETISALLILFLLSAYFPFRRHNGEVFVLFMACYAIHRFVNEMLRNDTAPVFAGMTLSQNGSILVLTLAVALLVYLWLKPTAEEGEKTTEPGASPA